MKTNRAHTITTLNLDSPQASKISFELEIGLELVTGLRERASTFTFCLPERCLKALCHDIRHNCFLVSSLVQKSN